MKKNSKHKKNDKNSTKSTTLDSSTNQPEPALPVKLFNDPKYAIFSIRVKPGAKISQVMSIDSEYINIQISAPPRDGEANKEVTDYVSEVLEIRKADIQIIQGMKAREKRLKVFLDNKDIQYYIDLLQKAAK
ncbi:UPF0235 protein C15orf40 [Zancudomyces culisetae]|uniref:UPF0235 protein C15orf40 n=1 Tax=Zancudomyces culisetae TaxID=1213189 RepID=A0A1R1PVQ1_ZANCU|nr:UPF0235 protein C15orf40 [Zancudomyces culisetae]|eukprot:OMH85009.1 UPF0235 protein C15orf40 [Zancudomyces culisetae]